MNRALIWPEIGTEENNKNRKRLVLDLRHEKTRAPP